MSHFLEDASVDPLKIQVSLRLPWWSSSQDSALPLQGVGVILGWGTKDPICLMAWPKRKKQNALQKKIQVSFKKPVRRLRVGMSGSINDCQKDL